MIEQITTAEQPASGEQQPTVALPSAVLGRRGLERLDLLLLVVESLDLNGGEAMLWSLQQLGLQGQFPNRVELWKRRCHNPLRRATRRGQLSSVDTEALIRLLCAMSERLYPLLHQLLSTREPDQLNQQRWTLLDQRLRDLIDERMNPPVAYSGFILEQKQTHIHRHLLVSKAT